MCTMKTNFTKFLKTHWFHRKTTGATAWIKRPPVRNSYAGVRRREPRWPRWPLCGQTDGRVRRHVTPAVQLVPRPRSRRAQVRLGPPSLRARGPRGRLRVRRWWSRLLVREILVGRAEGFTCLCRATRTTCTGRLRPTAAFTRRREPWPSVEAIVWFFFS